jgi:hypothetical protein
MFSHNPKEIALFLLVPCFAISSALEMEAVYTSEVLGIFFLYLD